MAHAACSCSLLLLLCLCGAAVCCSPLGTTAQSLTAQQLYQMPPVPFLWNYTGLQMPSTTNYPFYAGLLANFEIQWLGNQCLTNYKNGNASCPANYLNQTGILTVSNDYARQFCGVTCQNFVRWQLECINGTSHYGRLDNFLFNNGNTVREVWTASKLCCYNVTQGLPTNFTAVSANVTQLQKISNNSTAFYQVSNLPAAFFTS